MTPSLMRAAIF